MNTPDPLQAKIQVLVAALIRSSQAAPRLFLSLCLLAVKSNSDPEKFRSRLVRAGLDGPRAAEIKIVLLLGSRRNAADHTPPSAPPADSKPKPPTIFELFLAGKHAWKDTLAEARRQSEKDQGFEELNKLAAELVGIMHRQRIRRILFRNGTRAFELERRMITVHQEIRKARL